jgi:hypothetical protein
MARVGSAAAVGCRVGDDAIRANEPHDVAAIIQHRTRQVDHQIAARCDAGIRRQQMRRAAAFIVIELPVREIDVHEARIVQLDPFAAEA